MKLAGFFKIIPIAGVMMVIAGVVGLLLFGVQKCSAGPYQFDEEARATNRELGIPLKSDDIRNEATDGKQAELPINLSQVQSLVFNELRRFDSGAQFTTQNAVGAMFVIAYTPSSAAEICEALDYLDSFVRKLRVLQSGR